MGLLNGFVALNATAAGFALGLTIGGGLALAAHGAMAMESRR